VKYKSLFLIVIAFTTLAALYSALIPLGEGPDEPGHAAFAFFLAREARLPDQRAGEVPGEGHQPPLAYALAAPLAAWLPHDERALDQPGNARFTWAGGSETNAVAHGSREFWPWGGAVLAWHLMRLVSVLCGAATVVLTYGAARALLDERPRTNDETARCVPGRQSFVPLLAAVLVAFNPQFLFTSALVTNDALLAALSAAVVWLALRQRAAGGLFGYALAMGALLGLALLTKQSAMLLVPIGAGAVLQRGWRTGAARAFGALAACGAAMLLVSGWWFWRNVQLYGDPFGLALFQSEFTTQAFDTRSPAAWLGALAQLHSSFWARFGWMNVPAPAWVIAFFTLLEAAALLGWTRYFDERRKTNDQEANVHPRSFVLGLARLWPILALPLLALAWALSFALTAGLVAWQGRLIFPALPAIAILLAIGLSELGGKQLLAKLKWFLPVTCAALALWLPFGVVRPAYSLYTLPENVAQMQLGETTYARLGKDGDPGVELLGWQAAQPLQAGQPATLTLMWHARGRQDRDWTVFIHLVDADETIVAEDNTPPLSGAFPMTQWVAGDWVRDTHTLTIPAGLPPGEYRLRIGLFDQITNERAGVFSRGGRLLGDHHLVTELRVE
jgi:4-amino-4-deoxy-L-arabinose transferase-like glycosyltransferase